MLTFLYNFGTNISIERVLKSKEMEIELRSTKNELNRYKGLIDQQESLIKNLQKEIFDWHNKYNQLV